MGVLAIPDARTSIVALISSGAILATFGSALTSLGTIWERDLLERVLLNVDILFKEILKQEMPWRRWPFLPRHDRRKLLNDRLHVSELKNPRVALDVGTHTIRVDLPTVLEDFFDLPLLRNVVLLERFNKSFHTAVWRRSHEDPNPETGMTASQENMAYRCMLDIWRSILQFRVARYGIHLGSGLILSSFFIVLVMLVVHYGVFATLK